MIIPIILDKDYPAFDASYDLTDVRSGEVEEIRTRSIPLRGAAQPITVTEDLEGNLSLEAIVD